MQFNTEQQEAILHHEGPALVLAGPGSGKTTVMAGRILTLLDHYHIPPNQILVISFTRAASREIEDRFREQYPSQAPVRFGTIHAIFYRILKISRPGAVLSVLPEGLRRQWIKELLTELFGDSAWAPERLRQAEEFLLLGAEEEVGERFFLNKEEGERLKAAYKIRKQREGLLDFEDILEECRTLFREQPEILSAWQARFSHIMIDEYQDTSPLQLELLKMLAGRRRNLFAVGDDDQSIYGFRGAETHMMLRFGEDFPGARLYRLKDCYRCSPQILRAAGSLIAHNKKRYAKDLRSLAASGPEPVLYAFDQPGGELRALVEQLRRTEQEKQAGVHAKEMTAILCRTRFSLRRVAAALAGAGLDFACDEGPESDHSHWVAADLFAYLRLGRGSRSREDYLQVCNKPLRYISRQLFQGDVSDREALLGRLWEKPAMARQLLLFFHQLDRLGGLIPYGAVEYVRREMGYDGYLKEYAEKRGITPEPFYEILDRLQEESAAFGSVQEWEQAREALLKSGKESASGGPGTLSTTSTGRIQLMTMHGAKGLEFDRVYLPFLNEEEIPGSRAVKGAQIEEERRLLYVAMTRARSGLWMSCSTRKAGGRSLPSRFLKEIDGLVLCSGH